MSLEQQFCTFRVGPFFFGVEVDKVQEVVRQQAMTRVPLAPPEVRGLINLRGQIITAIDLRRRLHLPERPAGQTAMHVLLSTGGGGVSFEVDQIEDVLTLRTDTIEPVPEMLQPEVRKFLRGVSQQEDRLLLVLDECRALDLAA
jgi:purine-binding chemotaxis protein CheW